MCGVQTCFCRTVSHGPSPIGLKPEGSVTVFVVSELDTCQWCAATDLVQELNIYRRGRPLGGYNWR